jgi:hypothetical protein
MTEEEEEEGMDRTTAPGLRDRPTVERDGADRDRSGDAGRSDRRLRARRRAMPPPGAAELARMVAEFHARGGAVTVCPTVYVLPIQGGTAV